MSAACQPAPAHSRIAPMATAVLPLPTSPCTMRAMAWGAAKSRAISSSVRRWAPVGAKGMVFQKASVAPGGVARRGPGPRPPRISRTAAW